MSVELTIKKTLSEEEIADVITTAIEGGIGYWACLNNDTKEWADARKALKAAKAAKGEKDTSVYYNEIIWALLSHGMSVQFIDAEADDYDNPDDDQVWELTMEKFIKGLEIYEVERGSISKCLEDGNFDAIEADCVFQYALFGELIYG